MQKIREYFDFGAIAIGFTTLVCLIVTPQGGVFSEVLKYISALLGLLYFFYAAYMWFWKRVQFDWHMIHGHFLRKVVCFVLLVPFVATALISFFGSDSSLAQQLLVEGEAQQHQPSLFWSVYFHFMDPGNQNMAELPYGRGVAALIAILGVFLLNGLLVSSIVGWIDRRKDNWNSGDIRYDNVNFFGKYRFAVVIGANEIAASVIRNLFSKRRKGEINYKCEGENDYVILQTRRDVQQVRNELSAHLTSEQMERVVIYSALRDSEHDVTDLHLEYCTEIYVLGESTHGIDGETYHDALNMRCVNLIARELEKSRANRDNDSGVNGKPVRKVCKVMFEYQTTSSVFQFSDLPEIVKDNLVFIPFSRYDSWARKVIVDNGCETGGDYFEYCPLDSYGFLKDSPEFVHFVIVGMSKMGISMGVQALLQAHYPNSKNARTRITFIDSNADREMAFFKGRYDNLFELVRTRYIDTTITSESQEKNSDYNTKWYDPMEVEGCRWKHLSKDGKNFLDVEVEFIKGAVESEGVRNCLKAMSADQNARLTIAVCLTCTHQAVAASLYLPMEVYKNPKLQEIWVYQQEAADIVLNLSNSGSDFRYRKLKPFGMLFGEYMNDRSLYLKAMLVNVAYAISDAEIQIEWPSDISDRNDKNGYAAREEWRKLSVDKKWSNKYFADSIWIKLRNAALANREVTDIATIFKNNEDVLAVCEHNRWNVQQLLLGYSPCDEELDKIFAKRNKLGKKSKKVKEEYSEWKEKTLGESFDVMSSVDIKDDVKACELRIHPNICDISHVRSVDSGAEKYDKVLNNAIPQIMKLVDGLSDLNG